MPEQEDANGQRPVRAALDVLSSTRTSIVLLVLVAIAALVGTVLPDHAAQEYVYGRTWFHVLLGLLGVALFASMVWRRRTGVAKAWGLLAHVGILLVLAGALITLISAERGIVVVVEGREEASFHREGADPFRDTPVPLGFSVRLVDFRLRFYPPAHYLCVIRANSRPLRLRVRPGRALDIPGTECSLTDIGLSPVGVDGAPPRPGRAELRAKAVWPSSSEDLRLTDGDAVGSPWDPDSVLLYQQVADRVKEFESEVEVVEHGQVVRRHVIRVNDPLVHKGTRLSQADYDRRGLRWSQLSVSRDRGAWFVYAGFLAIAAGLVSRFYVGPLLSRFRSARGARGGDDGAL